MHCNNESAKINENENIKQRISLSISQGTSGSGHFTAVNVFLFCFFGQ